MLKFTLSDFIAYLRTQSGYQEKRSMGSREQLSQLHWNPGSNNYTIWAEYFKDYTNRNYQGQAWCFMFISTMLVRFIQERYHCTEREAHTEALIELNASILPYNCQLFVNKNTDRLKSRPEVGALVLFWTGSKYGHVGFVTSVDPDGSGFTSIEGNTSGAVNVVVPDGGAVVEKHHTNAVKNKFYKLQFASTSQSAPLEEYKILSIGRDGLKVTADSLRVRQEPGGTEVGFLNSSDRVYPIKKCFLNGAPWYYIEHPKAKGWVSAKYMEGWVKEECGRWWYVMAGYSFVVSDWLELDGKWYYFDNTGYLVEECYVKSKTANLWYYVNSLGEWDTTLDVTTEPKDAVVY